MDLVFPTLPSLSDYGGRGLRMGCGIVVDLLDCLGGILCGVGGTHHVADIGIHRLEDMS